MEEDDLYEDGELEICEGCGEFFEQWELEDGLCEDCEDELEEDCDDSPEWDDDDL